MSYSKPLPNPDIWNLPFWEAAQRHQFVLPLCGCGHRWFPAGPICPKCHEPAWKWAPASGQGRIWSWVVFHKSYFPGFADDLPYNVSCVRLDEGPMLLTNTIGVANGELEIDMPVHVRFLDIAPDWTLPVFEASL